MKKIIFITVLLLAAGAFVFYNCTKKLYDRVNPLDPLSGLQTTSTNPDGTTTTYHTGNITFDKTQYYTFTNYARITLTDADLTGGTQNINVKSTSDGAGITFTLVKAVSTYTGRVGFTNNTSVPGRKILVAHNDTVTATYNDANPAGARTSTANWKSNAPITTNHLGLFTETYTTPVWDTDIELYNWNWHVLATYDISDSGEAVEGNIYQRGVVTNTGYGGWWGWGIALINGKGHPATNDKSAWSGGSLHLTIKSSNNNQIRVSIKDLANHWVSLSSYGFSADGNWHTVSIPFSDFGAVDFTKMTYYFMLEYGAFPLSVGQVYHLDHVYWSKP